MYKLDFHADDYGITLHNSKRILELVKRGKLDSFSIIPNMNGYNDSMILLKKEWPSLPVKPRIAIHINLLGGYNVSTSKINPTDMTWGHILIKSIALGKKRHVFLDAIEAEITSQINLVLNDLKDIDSSLLNMVSIDSHVHTHMIPTIFKILIDVLKSMNIDKRVEYIRISDEPILPFIKSGVIKTCPITGLVKNIILKTFSIYNRHLLKKNHIPYGILCGLLMSGHMDSERLANVLPVLADYSKNKKLPVEIMLHPGIIIEKDHITEYIKDDVEAFFSEDRNVEYEAVMNRDKYNC